MRPLRELTSAAPAKVTPNGEPVQPTTNRNAGLREPSPRSGIPKRPSVRAFRDRGPLAVEVLVAYLNLGEQAQWLRMTAARVRYTSGR